MALGEIGKECMELGIVRYSLVKNFGLSEVVEVKKIRKCSNLVLVLKLNRVR